MATTNHQLNGSTEKKQHDSRTWLLLITSLAATVTFTAGLTPPGGFWAADDKANGYVAGTSVLRDKFPVRYRVFQVSNAMAFFNSLMIIGTLAANRRINDIRRRVFPFLVASCFLMLGTSFVTGTWDDYKLGICNIAIFVMVLIYTCPRTWSKLCAQAASHPRIQTSRKE